MSRKGLPSFYILQINPGCAQQFPGSRTPLRGAGGRVGTSCCLWTWVPIAPGGPAHVEGMRMV